MSPQGHGTPLSDVEELFEDAPCGYLITDLDGKIIKLNRALESLTGLNSGQLRAKRFQDLLSPGGRIYHETHYAPLLHMQGFVREVAVDLAHATGSRVPVLISSVLRRDEAGAPTGVTTIVFPATDRRRYEQQLMYARERDHDTAQRLQRSLLAGAAPSAPGIEIAMAYRSGVTHLEVGGDWHDAFWLTEPLTLALVVGDVVGSGIDAAAAMGQLRSAVRAFALAGMGPSDILVAVDEYSRKHEVGKAATLAYAQIDIPSREIRFASAGHPPPMLLTTGQLPTLMWEGRSPPIAAYVREPAIRGEAQHTLEPGTGLLLYTDGLVERRSASFDDGLETLRQMVATFQDQPLATMTAELIRTLRDDAHPDDVCLLAMRLRA